MRLHADSRELRRLRYDLIYTYKFVFGLGKGAAIWPFHTHKSHPLLSYARSLQTFHSL